MYCKMKLTVCVVFLVSFFDINFTEELSISQDRYAELPKIYSFNDTEKCPDDYVFCKNDIKLFPKDLNNPSKTWELIEQANNGESSYYRRDIVYRGECVETNGSIKGLDEFAKYGLVGSIKNSYCFSNQKLTNLVDGTDILFSLSLVCYTAFLIYCSMKSYDSRGNGEGSNQSAHKYLQFFSVFETWKDLRRPNRSEDFNRLLFIQGMRTIAMAMVIMAHNFIAKLIQFTRNPEYLEALYMHPFTKTFINSFGVVVQIFFIISAWLLAVQLHNIVKKNGKITLKDVSILVLNRYFRLMPSIIFSLFVHRSASLQKMTEPLYFSQVQLETNRCRNGWWRNLLFIQNLSEFNGDICSPGTWYIAADTQMYVMVLILFYTSQKWKIQMKYLLGVAVVVAVYIQGQTVLTTSFDGILYFSPRLLPGEKFFNIPEFVFSYVRTVCNIATYAIGFAFGTIYAENREKNIFNTPMRKMFCYIAFLGLPLLASLLSYPYKAHRGVEALLAITLRPMFGMGIAIGFLGMATNTGGVIKKFLEWAPLVFFGNFTYSVYVFHFFVVFVKACFWAELIELNHSDFVRTLVTDIIFSFALGVLMYIILEHPCIQLQKTILPQVKSKRETVKEHSKDS